MLKSMKRDKEVIAEKVGDNLYEYEDENGVRRQFYYDDELVYLQRAGRPRPVP